MLTGVARGSFGQTNGGFVQMAIDVTLGSVGSMLQIGVDVVNGFLNTVAPIGLMLNLIPGMKPFHQLGDSIINSVLKTALKIGDDLGGNHTPRFENHYDNEWTVNSGSFTGSNNFGLLDNLGLFNNIGANKRFGGSKNLGVSRSLLDNSHVDKIVDDNQSLHHDDSSADKGNHDLTGLLNISGAHPVAANQILSFSGNQDIIDSRGAFEADAVQHFNHDAIRLVSQPDLMMEQHLAFV